MSYAGTTITDLIALVEKVRRNGLGICEAADCRETSVVHLLASKEDLCLACFGRRVEDL